MLVLSHFDASGAALDTPIAISYLQGPLYRKSSAVADPSWYVYDGLGSVVGEVDVNGNLTASKLFDVYGLTRSASGSPTTRQGFVGGLGHESDDETGLIYMRARYYDPGTGRFISEDPGRDGTNWFAYVRDNPVSGWDPDGKGALLGSSCVDYLIQIWGKALSASEVAILEGENVEQQINLLKNLSQAASFGTREAFSSTSYDLGEYNPTNDVSKAGSDIAVGVGIMAQLAYTALFLNMGVMLELLMGDGGGYASMVGGSVVRTAIQKF